MQPRIKTDLDKIDLVTGVTAEREKNNCLQE